jgi:hypothetical protein
MSMKNKKETPECEPINFDNVFLAIAEPSSHKVSSIFKELNYTVRDTDKFNNTTPHNPFGQMYLEYKRWLREQYIDIRIFS